MRNLGLSMEKDWHHTMIASFKQPVVLMYHGTVMEWTILPKEREAGAELYDVETVNFQEQMRWLKAHQYNVDTLRINSSVSDNQRVVLTFDDGEMNNYEQALPILKKHGFPAYFFIIAKRIGQQGYMGWDELKRLHQAGMIIGSHGFSHEILTNLLDTQVEEELKASKKYLERNLNIGIDSFSIPRGFCNDQVIQMAYDAGYNHIFISDRPKSLKSECLSRVAVKADWPLKRFEQALKNNVPVNERVFGRCKSAMKRILGGGVYHWVRQTLLRMNR